jgi:hypothetical protein
MKSSDVQGGSRLEATRIRRFPRPVMPLVVVGIVTAALLVWLVAEMRAGWPV